MGVSGTNSPTCKVRGEGKAVLKGQNYSNTFSNENIRPTRLRYTLMCIGSTAASLHAARNVCGMHEETICPDFRP